MEGEGNRCARDMPERLAAFLGCCKGDALAVVFKDAGVNPAADWEGPLKEGGGGEHCIDVL